jgi:pyruvate/2-oxoglutarate dehydrogenase complex dihydrolipoamide acyltransferase (E2) component
VSDGVTSTQILAPAASILRDIATAENETAPVGTQLAVIATGRQSEESAVAGAGGLYSVTSPIWPGGFLAFCAAAKVWS